MTTNTDILGVEVSEMEGKYLTFFTDNQLFGVPIADVVQIVGMQEITEIPEFPHYAKGIIDLRGSIIPVIDIRLRLNKVEKSYDERTCIIVTQIDTVVIGFIVDAVDAVTDINQANISSPPVVSGDSQNEYITGVAKHEGKVVLLLDTTKILSDNAFESIANNIE